MNSTIHGSHWLLKMVTLGNQSKLNPNQELISNSYNFGVNQGIPYLEKIYPVRQGIYCVIKVHSVNKCFELYIFRIDNKIDFLPVGRS